MASPGLNKILLIGHLGKDPTLRYTPAGTAVATFTLAVNRPARSATGERQDEVEWFTIVAWGRLAETCTEFLTKGSKVFIDGRLQTRQWEDKDGHRHTAVEVVAGDLLMLGGARAPAAAATDEPRQAADQPAASTASVTDDLDEVPF